MTHTEQTVHAWPAAGGDPCLLRDRLGRPTVRRLFETWAEDMALLSNAVVRGQISEGEFFTLLDECRDRLNYYAMHGDLAGDVDRLTNLLATVDVPSGGAGPTAQEQDCSAPESDSGTEVATSNSKRIRKIRK